jgi:excisionase family DNA binding protein
MDGIMALQRKRLLRVDEVAKILNISRWTVYRWVEAGRLGGTRIGAGSLRIFSDTVAALIDHHCVGVPLATVVKQDALPEEPGRGAIVLQDFGRSGIRSRRQAAV